MTDYMELAHMDFIRVPQTLIVNHYQARINSIIRSQDMQDHHFIKTQIQMW